MLHTIHISTTKTVFIHGIEYIVAYCGESGFSTRWYTRTEDWGVDPNCKACLLLYMEDPSKVLTEYNSEYR